MKNQLTLSKTGIIENRCGVAVAGVPAAKYATRKNTQNENPRDKKYRHKAISMEKTPEQFQNELIALLRDIAKTAEEVTNLINVFPDYYEDMMRLLNVVKHAADANRKIHAAFAGVRDNPEISDRFRQQIDYLLRTQDWVEKNYALAVEATQKLSALEDVTLQFYDNPHPDVNFT